MKPEELAMLTITYNGQINLENAMISFPKEIPEWVRDLLDDHTNLKEDEGVYLCYLSKYSGDQVIKDHEKIRAILDLIRNNIDHLLKVRYIAAEYSMDHAQMNEFLEFIETFVENSNPENCRLTENILHGADNDQYLLFAVLTFISEWSGRFHYISDDYTMFECNRKKLPFDFTSYDIENIGLNVIDVIPFPIGSESGIEYIKIPYTNIFKSMEAWYKHSKDYRMEFIEFLRKEVYLKDTNCNNEDTGNLILNAVRGYLVKNKDFVIGQEKDMFLAKILSIFSNGKYKLFIREVCEDWYGTVFKYIPTTVTHSIASGNGCFSDLQLLINNSSYWYIDINGNITTTDIASVEKEEIVVAVDGVNAINEAMKFQKMYFSKLPIRMISIILNSQISMRNVAKEHSCLSYKDVKQIKEVDLLMYFANYYVHNSLDNQNEFFDWWGHVSRGVTFADSEICRNLNVLSDLFNDEKKIIMNSEEESINDKIWNIGLYGIYIFTLRCEMERPELLSEDQKNKLKYIRYAIPSKIKEIRNFPWKKQNVSRNPLMNIAEDPENSDGLSLILAAASLNIDMYTIYPAYQYFVKTITKEMIMDGYYDLDVVRKGSFQDIYTMLRDKLACNVVPINLYRFAILIIRSILAHRRKDIENDAKNYLRCLRILDNKFVSYRERNPLTEEYFSCKPIGQEVALKIVNYVVMNDFAKQVNESVDFLEKDRIFENWNRIMTTKEIMNRDNIGTFNESMIDFLNMLE